MKHIKLEYEQLYEFINLKTFDDVPHQYEYNLKMFNYIFKHEYVSLEDNEVERYLNSFNDYNIEKMYFFDLMYTSIKKSMIYKSAICFKFSKMIFKYKNDWSHHHDLHEFFLHKRDILNRNDVFIITK